MSKLPHTGTTIFSVMSALATEHKAINLSQGFPDYDCSDELKEMVNQAMQQGHNQYAPMPGLMQLRTAIAAKIRGLAIRLTKEFGVAAIPVSAFYHDGKDDHVVRFCFAKKETTLEQAAARLKNI